MKAWRAAEENLHSFLTSALNKLQAPAVLPPGKNHDTKSVRGLVGPHRQSRSLGEDTNILPLMEFEYRTLQPDAKGGIPSFETEGRVIG